MRQERAQTGDLLKAGLELGLVSRAARPRGSSLPCSRQGSSGAEAAEAAEKAAEAVARAPGPGPLGCSQRAAAVGRAERSHDRSQQSLSEMQGCCPRCPVCLWPA